LKIRMGERRARQARPSFLASQKRPGRKGCRGWLQELGFWGIICRLLKMRRVKSAKLDESFKQAT
jgi:hypothetical protein